MKDRDEQHYDHEESEYHFSDDDVSYEVETEASKPVAPEPEKKAPLAGISPSKRMIISLVVFLGLVFVVYKMVSPGTTVPSTEISPVATTQPAVPDIAPPALPHTVQTPAPVAAAPAQPVAPAEVPAAPVQAPATPMQAAAAPVPAPATTTTTTTVVTTPAAPAAAQPVAAASPVAQAAPTVAPQPIAQTQQPSAIPAAPLTTPPSAAPAMSPNVASPAQQQPLPVATTVVTTPAVTPTNTDATIAAMAATNEKLMNQLQADYSQKVTDFSNQNKALQDQMQTLSSRVAGLELQLNQLVQTLTRQTGMGGTTSLNVVPAQQPAPLIETKIRYSVQAIIPGRAWLKSDNGETLTVAEGDTIRDLGRVTKVDPYDGVVEVNTGSKTVSISYGNGG